MEEKKLHYFCDHTNATQAFSCRMTLPAEHRFKEVGQYHCIRILKSYKLYLQMLFKENHMVPCFSFWRTSNGAQELLDASKLASCYIPALDKIFLWALCHQANLSLLCQIAFLPSSSRFLLFFLFDFRLPWIARNRLKLEQIGYLPTESMNSIWWLAHSTLLAVLLPTTARGHESFDRTST